MAKGKKPTSLEAWAASTASKCLEDVEDLGRPDRPGQIAWHSSALGPVSRFSGRPSSPEDARIGGVEQRTSSPGAWDHQRESRTWARSRGTRRVQRSAMGSKLFDALRERAECSA